MSTMQKLHRKHLLIRITRSIAVPRPRPFAPVADHLVPKQLVGDARPAPAATGHASVPGVVPRGTDRNRGSCNKPPRRTRWLVGVARRFVPQLLFTENETNTRRLYGFDGTDRTTSRTASTTFVVNGSADAVNPDEVGTKAAAVYRLRSRRGSSTATVRLRLFVPRPPVNYSAPRSIRFSTCAVARPTNFTTR